MTELLCCRMVPVDEFLPIMYGRHPNSSWAEQFPTRDLLALRQHTVTAHSGSTAFWAAH